MGIEFCWGGWIAVKCTRENACADSQDHEDANIVELNRVRGLIDVNIISCF